MQGDVGGLLSAVTGITGGLTGISGRHLLQSPPSPVTDQLLGAVTDAGNTVVTGVNAALTTLELVPPPPASRNRWHCQGSIRAVGTLGVLR